MEIFSKRFCEELKNCDFSQIELAQKLNVDPTNITNWKKGKNMPSAYLLAQLCKLLNVSSDYLLGLNDNVGVLSFAPELPEDERKLLETFRKLTLKNKMHVTAYATVRLEEQERGTRPNIG